MPKPFAAVTIQRRDVWVAVASFCVVGAVLVNVLAGPVAGRTWPTGTRTTTSVADDARAVLPGQLDTETMTLERTVEVAEIESALVPRGVSAYQVAVEVRGRDDATISRERRLVTQVGRDGVATGSAQNTAEVTEFNASGDAVQKTEQIDVAGQVLRFPADTQEVAYAVWDPHTGRAWGAQFVRATTVSGHRVLEFRQQIPETSVAASVVTLDRRMWVRPEIGAVVEERLKISMRTASTELLLLDADFRDTDASVERATEAVDNVLAQRLWLQIIIPSMLLLLGMLAAAAAIISARQNNREKR